jgi:hypothetical protein
MKETYDNHKPAFRDNVVTLGGLLTFCLIGTVQMLGSASLSAVQLAFLTLSAIAVPLLATSVSFHYLEYPYKYTRRPWYTWWCVGIGTIAGLAAVITAFFTFHWIAGLVALFSCAFGLAVMWFFIDELKEANPDAFPENDGEKSSAQKGPGTTAKSCPTAGVDSMSKNHFGEEKSPNNAMQRISDPRHVSCGAGGAPESEIR